MVTDSEINFSPVALRTGMLLAALDLIDRNFKLFDSELS
jgi:hypothetical protein